VNSRPAGVARNRRRSPLAALRAWLTGAGLALASAATAQERAADLLPPQPVHARPAITPRATGADLNPDELPPPIKPKPRDPNFQYPPTYTSTKSTSFLGDAWKKVTHVFADDEKDKEKEKEKDKKPQNGAKVAAPAPTHTAHQSIQPVPIVAPGGALPAPSWKWYGYGAPVPGANPSAPRGVYGKVNPGWYAQTGATPGAIPHVPLADLGAPAEPTREAPTLPPAEPVPDEPKKKDEPKKDKDEKTGIIFPPDRMPAGPVRRPADLELPIIRPTSLKGSHASPPVLPLSAKSAAPVWRGQAPEPAWVTDSLIAGLRSACAGRASHIELRPTSPGKLGLRLTLTPGATADALAERLRQLPDLADYEVEMEFVR
jgi:hypothetical protein